MNCNFNILGTHIRYYFSCKTQLWYYHKNITCEHTSDLVYQGKIVHETSYQKEKKSIFIDNVNLDYIKKGNRIILHEVKKSIKLQKSHIYQLLFYIDYLKNKKSFESVEGVLNYPEQKKIVKVELTKDKEVELKEIIDEIKKIISEDKPPHHILKPFCPKCSYYELCWC